MQRSAKRKVHGDTFVVDSTNDLLFVYTKQDTYIIIYKLSSFKPINTIALEDKIVNISISYPSVIITTSTHIIARNIYTNLQSLCVYIPGCINAYFLEDKKILAVYEKTFYIYNHHNQEESKYNYEILKLINGKVFFYLNGVVNILQNGSFIDIHRIVDPIQPNLDFDIYRNKVTIMNGNDVYNKNFRLHLNYFPTYPETFIFTANYIYFCIKNKIYIYDRKENKNVNLLRYATRNNRFKGIRPINLTRHWTKEYIEYDAFELVGKYLIVLKNKVLYSYKMLENNLHKYIICDISYDYKEAECEFDCSNESSLIE